MANGTTLCFQRGRKSSQLILTRLLNAVGALVLHDARLNPGDVVEITVRPVTAPASGLSTSFLDIARTAAIDAPADYSERFDDGLRPEA
jgi:hypothetical protein